MWDYVGIVRTDKRLKRALNRAQLLAREIHIPTGNAFNELRNLVVVSELIIRASLNVRNLEDYIFL